MEHLGELAQEAIPPIVDTTQDSTFRSTVQCTRKVDYRAARIGDSTEIARYICKAGGGLYEFLFNDLFPFMTAAEFLAAGVAREDYPISYRNCFIAFDPTNDRVLGVANAFPANLLRKGSYPFVPRERQEHIRAMLQLQEWDSLFLNALAVDDDTRHLGVGTRLLRWAQSQARAAGFAHLSLHVWADNSEAIEFYTAQGFIQLAVAEVAPHPRLSHSGGSVLMSLAVDEIATRNREASAGGAQ